MEQHPAKAGGVKIGEHLLALLKEEKNFFWVKNPEKIFTDVHSDSFGPVFVTENDPKMAKSADRHSESERK